MWKLFTENITDVLKMVCTILAFAIPYSVYKINKHLRDIGDPPWQQEENRNKK